MIGRTKLGQFKKGFRGRASLNFKHGHRTNLEQTPEYRSWAQVWQRTTWPKNPAWKNYGGSKVQMAIRWRGRDSFDSDRCR